MEEQIYNELAKYVNWVLVLMIGATIEVIKIFLPDQYEARIIPFLSMVLGILLAIFMLKLGVNGIYMGVTSGIVASGCYAFIIKMIEKIFTGGKDGK